MRIKRFSYLLVVLMPVMILTNGCISQQKYDQMKSQNRIQQQRITTLESDLDATRVKAEQMQKQLESLQGLNNTDIEAKDKEISALEEDIAKKKELIARMRDQLLSSGVKLPVELSVMLQEFAKDNDMVTFDADSGVLKFKSDLLFDKGSDTIGSGAIEPVTSFCSIMNSKEAEKFDIVIAGHTDDVPIKKPATKAKHPTNWHLSVHRAIAVLDLMTKNQISPQRVNIRGFGEYRPVESNEPNQKGNPANRRVEIFVVPSGT